jgi:hypothetical protein
MEAIGLFLGILLSLPLWLCSERLFKIAFPSMFCICMALLLVHYLTSKGCVGDGCIGNAIVAVAIIYFAAVILVAGATRWLWIWWRRHKSQN